MDDKIEYINVYHLKPDPNNPRSEIAEEFIEKLVENYRQHGIIEPIEVDENNVIRRGHQRVEAAKRAGIDRVPVRRVIGLAEEKWLERQLSDDALRRQLSSVDRAFAYATGVVNINTGKYHTVEEVKEMWKKDKEKLLNLVTFGEKVGRSQRCGQAELSRRVGIPQQDISYYLNILKLDMVEAVESGKTTPATIREISIIKDEDVKEVLLERAKKGDIEKRDLVRELKEIVSKEEVPKELKVAVAKDAVSIDDVKEVARRIESDKSFEIPIPAREELEKIAKADIESAKDMLEFAKDFGIQVRRLYLHLMGDLNFLRQFAEKRICPLCGSPLKLRLDCCSITVDEAWRIASKAWETRTPPTEKMKKIIETKRVKEITEGEKELEELKKNWSEFMKKHKE